jgi:hypothetical protein
MDTTKFWLIAYASPFRGFGYHDIELQHLHTLTVSPGLLEAATSIIRTEVPDAVVIAMTPLTGLLPKEEVVLRKDDEDGLASILAPRNTQ